MRARRPSTRACVAGALAVALAGPSAGAARAAPRGWAEAAAEIAAPWPGLQRADGHFADYIVRRAPGPKRDDYGDAMLGYGLLLTADRTGSARMRDAGLRAVAHAARGNGHVAVAPFRFLALASAYNLARRRFAGAPLLRSHRAALERALRRARATRVGRARVTNKSVVEAAAILELVRSGLRSHARGTVLNRPGHSAALARRFLARDLPRAARRFERSAGSAGRVAVLGDFPSLPLSYHALASGFLARSIELLGPRAPAAARTLLRRAGDASWAAMAPNGDVAYLGRSQEQSWTLPLTAYAAETAATEPGGAPRAGRYRAVSERAVTRLRSAYGAGREGFFVTPALRQSLRGGIRGLDPYVAAASYNGLTLVAMNWAIARARGATPATAIGADGDASFRIGRGRATLTTVRHGDTWFAVKQSHSGGVDLRYDFGLVALEVRGADGSWRPVLPVRPRVERASDTTAGPLLRRGRATGRPYGRATSVARDGTVTVAGGFATARGRRLRGGVRFRFEPTACGARLRVPARRGDRFEYSAFFSGTPAIGARGASDARQAVALSGRAAATRSGGYASGADPRVTRVRFRLTQAGAGTLSIETCAR